MTFSRRDFIRTAGIAFGAVTLPSWVYDAQAATNLYIDVNKNNLADIALATGEKARRFVCRYSDQPISHGGRVDP